MTSKSVFPEKTKKKMASELGLLGGVSLIGSEREVALCSMGILRYVEAEGIDATEETLELVER